MVTSKNFQYFNNNPKSKGPNKTWNRADCAVRVICVATGLPWVDAYKKMYEYSLEVYDMPNSHIGLEAVMKGFGFVKGENVKPNKGEKWPLVKDIAKKFKNDIIIASCCGHTVCCKEGKFFDTFDSGDMTVRKYWIKTK